MANSLRLMAGVECRATWCGRWRWLWRVCAAGLLLIATLAPTANSFLDSWAFQVLCLAAAWVPAWLGGDLLSTRFRENPDPHRRWTPRELLARAVGRLGPYLATQAVWVAVFTGREVFATFNGGGFSITNENSGDVAAWVTWTAVFQCAGLYVFAWAALLSAGSHRPRRWLAVPALLLLVAVVDTLSIQAVGLGSQGEAFWEPFTRPWESLVAAGRIPNVLTGYTFATWLSGSQDTGDSGGFARLCALAGAGFLLASIPPFLLTWRIARCRHRPPPQRMVSSGA